jgi:hypothetical protein
MFAQNLPEGFSNDATVFFPANKHPAPYYTFRTSATHSLDSLDDFFKGDSRLLARISREANTGCLRRGVGVCRS